MTNAASLSINLTPVFSLIQSIIFCWYFLIESVSVIFFNGPNSIGECLIVYFIGAPDVSASINVIIRGAVSAITGTVTVLPFMGSLTIIPGLNE